MRAWADAWLDSKRDGKEISTRGLEFNRVSRPETGRSRSFYHSALSWSSWREWWRPRTWPPLATDLRQVLYLKTIGQADSARSHVNPHGWRNDRVEHLVRGEAVSNGVLKALSIIFHASVMDGDSQRTCLITDA